jgi:GTPase SAR1 family protein
VPSRDLCERVLESGLLIDDQTVIVSTYTNGEKWPKPSWKFWTTWDQRSYMLVPDGILLVFSVFDESSFQAVDDLIEHSRRPSNSIQLLLVGNLHDVADTNDDRRVTKQRALAMSRRLDCDYVEVDTREGRDLHVREVFSEFVRRVQMAKDHPGERLKKSWIEID